MWAYETQSQMINSSAAIMRAFAVAAARTMSASAYQGMKVWSGLLKAEPAAAAGGSSYRSAGGHAVAQVIVGS